MLYLSWAHTAPLSVANITKEITERRAAMSLRSHERQMGIEAAVLRDADGFPSRCSRHGRTAVAWADFRIISRPPPPTGSRVTRLPWAGILDIIRELAWFTMHVKATPVRRWPACSRCRVRRLGCGALTRILFWGGLLAFLAALAGGLGARMVTGEYAPGWVMAPLLGGFGAMLAAAIPLTVGRWDKIARAETTVDGGWVRFTRPHPGFSDQMHDRFGHAWRTDIPADGAVTDER
jgi:hypothetical protein